jgi:hypothetical protein
MHTNLVSSDSASAISETTPYTQPAWPLPGTMLPHAHLSWGEWVTRISEELPTVAPSTIEMAASEPDSIRYLEHYATMPTLPTWPLPATSLNNFRISWAEWVDNLTGASSSRPSQTPEKPSHEVESAA